MTQKASTPDQSPSGHRPKKVPVSVLVVLYSTLDRYLLIQRADKPDYWQSVTGSLDWPDEPPIDAAVREVAEETGLLAQADLNARPMFEMALHELALTHTVRPWPFQHEYEIFQHWRHRYPEGVTHNTEHWFYVCVPDGWQPVLNPREHLASQWLEAEDAARLCFSYSNADAIRELSARLRGEMCAPVKLSRAAPDSASDQ